MTSSKYKVILIREELFCKNRINVGSLGLVTKELSGGYVSSIYIVFRVKSQFRNILNPEYLLYILKTSYYLGVINKYDTKYGAVRANLTYEQLCNIKIPLLEKEEMNAFLDKTNKLNTIKEDFQNLETDIKEFIHRFLPH